MTDRKTKIIATVGPATDSPEMLEKMILAGVNIFRINMSHSKEDTCREIVANIRKISSACNKVVGILMDAQGPAIRTAETETSLELEQGETVALTVRGEVVEGIKNIGVNYDDLVNDLSEGDTVIVDNGIIHLKVLSKKGNVLHCEVLTAGTLGSRKHINLPGVRVNLPALTEKDMTDIALGIELKVDFIAMSFVREASDVTKLRGILDYKKAPQKIIAKIEDQQGIKNIDAIIEVADAIMVARGDLGIEVSYEELPIIQRRVVKHCILQGKPVIVATHMLESMIENPSPTRAEITDVANAIYEQCDAIMLSGETSIGKYPEKCVEVMDRMARRIERSGGADYTEQISPSSNRSKMMKNACSMAEDLDAALVVFTQTGRMSRYASWFRPQCNRIFCFTNNAVLINQLSLFWGLNPFLIDFDEADPSVNGETATRILKDKGLLESGDLIVVVTDLMVQGSMVETVQMREVK
ncbi:MAG: pyruvate kinase [Lentisphaeria bacterium]|nr:pyruvate kinase [Lentisphaeria bacterium]NQZ67625.1 pyruvate kinase [Lentisphaeria bacterium]